MVSLLLRPLAAVDVLLWPAVCDSLVRAKSDISLSRRCLEGKPKVYRLRGGEMANSHLQAAIVSSTFPMPWPSAVLEILAGSECVLEPEGGMAKNFPGFLLYSGCSTSASHLYINFSQVSVHSLE